MYPPAANLMGDRMKMADGKKLFVADLQYFVLSWLLNVINTTTFRAFKGLRMVVSMVIS